MGEGLSQEAAHAGPLETHPLRANFGPEVHRRSPSTSTRTGQLLGNRIVRPPLFDAYISRFGGTLTNGSTIECQTILIRGGG